MEMIRMEKKPKQEESRILRRGESNSESQESFNPNLISNLKKILQKTRLDSKIQTF